jgi:hypothetical protein
MQMEAFKNHFVSKIWWNLVNLSETQLNLQLKPKTFLSFPNFYV